MLQGLGTWEYKSLTLTAGPFEPGWVAMTLSGPAGTDRWLESERDWLERFDRIRDLGWRRAGQ